ncbi:WS/DGAT/MGAT family O-acyltransferase [Bailinhaonella thermotolerans]|nr:wax ester/triacylglycerol synthase family O-acyltransferase [Bailinhaonella thermotolerans]
MMRRASEIDTLFASLESGKTVLHVAGLCLFDGELTMDRLRRHLEPRLHLVPRLRRRLVEVPLGLARPYWADDPGFDIADHLDEVTLLAPGDETRLAELVSRLAEQPLDRGRPLWEAHLIHGLAGGGTALFVKVHHAIIDGVSAADALAGLLDLGPEPREAEPAPPWRPAPLPGAPEVVARAAADAAAQPFELLAAQAALVRELPGLVGGPARDLAGALAGRVRRALAGEPTLAPRTPFNGVISPHRNLVFRTLPFDDVRRIGKSLDCTVNDAVMALCAGALRRWLAAHDALPDAPLSAVVPVSTRTADTRGAEGPRISAVLGVLPVHLADPRDRLAAVRDSMRRAKRTHARVPVGTLVRLLGFAPPALAALGIRALTAARWPRFAPPPFNLIVSNVPGPDFPLYLAGVRMTGYHPFSILFDGQGLNITAQSYAGGLHLGLTCCAELVPDPETLAEHFEEELEVYRAFI